MTTPECENEEKKYIDADPDVDVGTGIDTDVDIEKQRSPIAFA